MNWLKWLGGGTPAPEPELDPPDVTANRVEHKRREAMKRWAIRKAEGPLPEKITRAGVEKILKDRGYKKRALPGESQFLRHMGDRTLCLWISLKTLGESELYPPSQRLLLTASMTTEAFSDAESEIKGGTATGLASLASLGQRDLRDYVFTPPQVDAIFEGIEAEICDIDIAQALARIRGFETSRPGSAGPQLLTALALAGDIDTLDGYVRRRMQGDPCGFVPFVTDDFIARAAKIAHRYG